jgi:hypothetical protein
MSPFQDAKVSFLATSLASMVDCVAPHPPERLCQLVSSRALATMAEALVSVRDRWRRIEALLQV